MDTLPFLIFASTMMFLIGVVGSTLYWQGRIKRYKDLLFWYQRTYPDITHPTRRRHQQFHGAA